MDQASADTHTETQQPEYQEYCHKCPKHNFSPALTREHVLSEFHDRQSVLPRGDDKIPKLVSWRRWLFALLLAVHLQLVARLRPWTQFLRRARVLIENQRRRQSDHMVLNLIFYVFMKLVADWGEDCLTLCGENNN